LEPGRSAGWGGSSSGGGLLLWCVPVKGSTAGRCRTSVVERRSAFCGAANGLPGVLGGMYNMPASAEVSISAR